MSWVLFFDAGCGFCSRSVRFVARHDVRRRVWFAPLQGRLAAQYGLQAMSARTGGSMVVLREEDGRSFTCSDAVLELARALGGIWNIARLAVLVPRAWRDGAYQWIADRRHRIMGTADACTLDDDRVGARLRE